MEFTAPYAADKLRRAQPLALDEFEFPARRDKGDAEDHAAVAFDHALLSLHGFCRPRRVSDVEAFFADLDRIFREEIAELAQGRLPIHPARRGGDGAACAIQRSGRRSKTADENPDTLVDLYIESLNDAVADAPADVAFGVHMCRGNFKGHYLGAGGYESVAERFFCRHAM